MSYKLIHINNSEFSGNPIRINKKKQVKLFFRKIFIYLAVLSLTGSSQDLPCPCWIFSFGVWDFFSCGMGNLVPQPGMEPRPPALGTWSLSHWTAREVPGKIIFNYFG